jgi:hypothetical protein
MSSEVEDEFRNKKDPSAEPKWEPLSGKISPANPGDPDPSHPSDSDVSPLQPFLAAIQEGWKNAGKLPPIQVDDTDLLLYDTFLLVNLSVS